MLLLTEEEITGLEDIQDKAGGSEGNGDEREQVL